MHWRPLYEESDRFQRTVLTTVAITFFLILVGGLVRAAGAGLGCPDWPRCFGFWIPPFTAEALPPQYDPADFNVYKTWLEYVNRLVGVVVGLFILATFVMSWAYRRTDRSIFFGALASLILVLFQGWLGGMVVRSALAGWMITLHMLIAVLILNTLLFTAFRALRHRLRVRLPVPVRNRLGLWVSLLIAATLLQVLLGSQVREALQEISHRVPALPRGEWMDEVGLLDAIHRSFSWAVLGLSLAWYFAMRKAAVSGLLMELSKLNNSAVVIQILLGVGLAYGGVPPVLQLFHLVVAAFMTSVQFGALLVITHASAEST